MGGWMWGGASEKDAIKAIHGALDEDMTLIDTAPIYGFGLSERIMGKALNGRRDKAIVATKCGMICDTEKGEAMFNATAADRADDGHIGIRIFLGPDSIRRELEASLQRLQTDYIDLYQTHWQEKTTPIEDTMAVLIELKDQGKIRAIGVSNASPDQMDAYRKSGPIDSDQEQFSMIRSARAHDNLPYCEENGIAVLAYSPLVQGLLTGKVPPEREFEENDQRAKKKLFSVNNRKRIAQMLEVFKPVAQKHDCTLAQLTIAWTIHQPGCTHALAGARRPGQVSENAKAGDIQLSQENLDTMNGAIEEYIPQLEQ